MLKLALIATAFIAAGCASTEPTAQTVGRRDGVATAQSECKPIRDPNRSAFCDSPGVNAQCPPPRTTCDGDERHGPDSIESTGANDLNRIVRGVGLPGQ